MAEAETWPSTQFASAGIGAALADLFTGLRDCSASRNVSSRCPQTIDEKQDGNAAHRNLEVRLFDHSACRKLAYILAARALGTQ